MEENVEESKGKTPIDKNTALLIAIGAIALIVAGLIGSNFFPNTSGLVALPSDEGLCLSGEVEAMNSIELGEKVENYLNEGPFLQEGMLVKASSVEEFGDTFYSVKLDIMQDEEKLDETVVFATRDGKLLFGGTPIDLDAPLPEPEPEPEPEPAEVQKSDKPEVEVFVMSHCPYGTQIEKGILPVVELLGDKIDFKVRFVYYAMHGETEIKEETRQYCIQKEQTAKFIPYLSCFLKEGNTEACLAEAEVDEEALNSCVAQADSEFEIIANLEDESKWLSGYYPLFNVDKELNDRYMVQSDRWGSPQLVINGTVIEGASRDSASLLQYICSAFNNPPEECIQELSSETPSSGFGYEGSNTSSGSCG